ncbi:hypothetical protein ACIQU4_39410 [Streptomyces sp. NPDC090741]|uniref:hypothetical protein n=1 Tax=Streptomyces sp. NPDC090741 TaxID=3365967 RepID=UPI0037FA753F
MASDLIEDRSDESYLLEIQDITLTPSFPVPGQPLTVELVGKLREQVDLTKVIVNVQVKLGNITLSRRTQTLLYYLESVGAPGDYKPAAGPWKQTWTFPVQRAMPKADFRIYVQSSTTGPEEKDFADLNVRFDFRTKQ